MNQSDNSIYRRTADADTPFRVELLLEIGPYEFREIDIVRAADEIDAENTARRGVVRWTDIDYSDLRIGVIEEVSKP